MMSYQYTAIGDSLTTGFGALPGNGFVPVYRRMAEARLRTPIRLTNLGINGLTTDGLEQRLKADYNFRLAVSDADLITISIGGNDLIKAVRRQAAVRVICHRCSRKRCAIANGTSATS